MKGVACLVIGFVVGGAAGYEVGETLTSLELGSIALRATQAATRSAPRALAPSLPSPVAVTPAPVATTSAPSAVETPALAAQERQLEAACSHRDGKKLLRLFVELSHDGRAAWPALARCGAELARAAADDDGYAVYGIRQIDVWRARATADVKDLCRDTIQHPGDYERDFRLFAAETLLATDSDGVGREALEALRSERDPAIFATLVSILIEDRESVPDATRELAALLPLARTSELRRSICRAISRTGGEEATSISEQLLATETDGISRRMLEEGQRLRAVPLRGLFVTSVRADSDADAAGIQEGDVIVTLDGRGVTGWEQLHKATHEADASASVVLGVWREGRTFAARVACGRPFWEVGLNGEMTPAR